MKRNTIYSLFIALLISSTLIISGCGGGGGGSNASVGNDEGSTASAPSYAYSIAQVSGGLGYVLDANVEINGTLSDIIIENGQYEWLSLYEGTILSADGAIDIVDPIGTATTDDPAGFRMQAPDGYYHVNPFTSLMVLGVENLEDNYSFSFDYPGMNGLAFNFDTVAVALSNEETGYTGNINIARESIIALLDLANREANLYRESTELDSELTQQILDCQTVECLKDIAKDKLMLIFYGYVEECEPLPGLEECLNYSNSSTSSSEASSEMAVSSEAAVSSEMAVSSEAAVSSEMAVSSEAVVSSQAASSSSVSTYNPGTNPFPI